MDELMDTNREFLIWYSRNIKFAMNARTRARIWYTISLGELGYNDPHYRMMAHSTYKAEDNIQEMFRRGWART
jgi:hypothetical protein